jgi:hypothetical protein
MINRLQEMKIESKRERDKVPFVINTAIVTVLESVAPCNLLSYIKNMKGPMLGMR